MVYVTVFPALFLSPIQQETNRVIDTLQPGKETLKAANCHLGYGQI